MNKRNRVIGFVLVVIMAVMMFAGCADTTDWENVQKATVVARVNDYEISMDLIKYYYAEAVAANDISATLAGTASSSVFGEEGSDVEVEQDVIYSECIENVLLYAALAKVAENEGLAITYDEGREIAYSDLILSTKNKVGGMNEYFAQYLSEIKQNYTATDEALCDVAGELYMFRTSSEKLVEKYYKDGEFEDDAEAVKEVTRMIKDQLKGMEIKRVYPKEKNVSIDVEAYVESEIMYL